MEEESQRKDIIITRVDERSVLQIGTEGIDISDYKIQSSANGGTELWVKIEGCVTQFELSASLEEQRR